MATLKLADIPTLRALYSSGQLMPAKRLVEQATSRYNDKISLLKGDITRLEVDSIVNAANERLLGGGGVDGAIHRAAGDELLEECKTLGGCDTGSAKITRAYSLPSKRIIHAVGPIYYNTKAEGQHTRLLQSCYTTSLDLAEQNDCRSIAFPSISTGVYGYPSAEAAEDAIAAVKAWLDRDPERAARMERIVFCTFLDKDESAYLHHLPHFFPPGDN